MLLANAHSSSKGYAGIKILAYTDEWQTKEKNSKKFPNKRLRHYVLSQHLQSTLALIIKVFYKSLKEGRTPFLLKLSPQLLFSNCMWRPKNVIHIISKSIKPLSDLSVPTRGEFVILEKTPSHEQKNISSWDKGDHKEHLCIDFLSSKKGANELNPDHATMQNASRYPGGDPGAPPGRVKSSEFFLYFVTCLYANMQ